MIAAALALCCAAVSPAGLNAGPARRGTVKFVQPDGSTFDGYVRGDEFCHFKTTLSGQVIAQDGEGWWCYASTASDGTVEISGTRVNSAAPSVLSLDGASAGQFPGTSARRAVFDRRLEERRISMRRFLGTGDGTATKAAALPKQKHGIVILAEFSDEPFTYKRSNFVNMLTQDGYSYGGATGSALDYFNAQFGGSVEFSFDVSEIVTLPREKAYYGGNDKSGADKNPEQMVIDACKGAAELGVDFSKYDDDNDGYVDNVFIFFSGGDEADGAGDDCIWSHAYYIESGTAKKTLRLNGKRIDSYACTAELTPEIVEYGGGYAATGKYVLAGIGTFCHEYSHTFGLPDLYDTDYEGSGGQAEALWYSIGLMDGGNANNGGNTPPNYNAIDREFLGIGQELSLSEGTATLEPVNRAGQYFRVDTDTEGEYFLIECRSENETWDGWIGGSGMLIYHIDKSASRAGMSESYGMVLTAAERYEYNEVNCRPDRQCADLIEADPAVVKQAYRQGEFSPTDAQTRKVFFPCGSYNTIGPSSGLTAWDGNSCGVQIYGIRANADGSVSFSTGLPKEMSASVEKSVFQDVAILDIWTANVEGDITVKYGVSGKTLSSEVSVQTAGQDRYMVKLTGLTPKTAYKAEIYASAEGSQVKIGSVSFTTKTADGIYPAISVAAAGRNEDGSFSKGTELPLVVNNAADAKDTEWLIDGKKIEKGKDIFLTVEKTGVLKAVLTYSDGRQRCIYKKIVVK